jgi:hypothetical protein
VWTGLIKTTDIYAAVNDLLRYKYPTYNVCGHNVAEGFKKPCFFADVRLTSASQETVNYLRYVYGIQITYFPVKIDEIDNLTKADEIRELFGYHIVVCSRGLMITDYDYEFVGEKTNILQISIDIEFYDDVEKVETHETMKTLEFNETKE